MYQESNTLTIFKWPLIFVISKKMQAGLALFKSLIFSELSWPLNFETFTYANEQSISTQNWTKSSESIFFC